MPKVDAGPKQVPSCGTCLYRVDQTYECRRFPPAPVVVGQQDKQRVEYRWPRMENNDWCGEYYERGKEQ